MMQFENVWRLAQEWCSNKGRIKYFLLLQNIFPNAEHSYKASLFTQMSPESDSQVLNSRT